jgi:hypothetical protein
MTDKQKLQSLFDAALKAPAEFSSSPQRAVPVPAIEAMPEPAAVISPVFAPPSSSPAAPAAPAAPVAVAIAPMPAAPTLDPAAAEELGKLLDEQLLRKKRRRRIEALVTACLFFGSTAGGTVWFVQDEARVQAFKEAMRDIRSVGDVKSLVAKYQDALDRIAARGQQIEQATAAMGIKPSASDEKDPFFEEEMKQMMGNEGGKTVGERNRLLKQNFAHMEKENGGPPKPNLSALKALKEEQSFDWGN